MCFGSVKNYKKADEFYEEMKKDYGPLPSVSMDKAAPREQVLQDISPIPRRTGTAPRSLLRMQNNY